MPFGALLMDFVGFKVRINKGGYSLGNTEFFIIADKTICYCLVL